MPYYPELRKVLGNQYRNLPAEHIESFMEGLNLNAEDTEDFLSTLGNIGKSVVSALPKVLPTALPLVGSAIGGPIGGLVGGAAGQALGSALAPGQAGQPPVAAAPGTAPPSGPGMPAPTQAPGGSPAAGELLQTLFRPETLQALISMLMGMAGKQNIPVGKTPVPVGAFTNLLGVLANQAAAEYHAGSANSYASQRYPRYFENYAGEAYGDPAIPEHRAAALLELFRESDGEQDEAVPALSLGPHLAHESDPDLDEMYDAMDVAELYGEYEFA